MRKVRKRSGMNRRKTEMQQNPLSIQQVLALMQSKENTFLCSKCPAELL